MVLLLVSDTTRNTGAGGLPITSGDQSITLPSAVKRRRSGGESIQ
jgi:hypothetical protein